MGRPALPADQRRATLVKVYLTAEEAAQLAAAAHPAASSSHARRILVAALRTVPRL